MAKDCIICGKSIGLLSKPLKLAAVKECVCERCTGKVDPLFRPLQQADWIRTGNQHAELDTQFDESIGRMAISAHAASLLKKVFYMMQLAKSKLPAYVRSLKADFAESYEMVKRAGDAAVKREVTANIVRTGEAVSATFVYETSPVLDSLTVLVITMVNCNGITTVNTKGASDMFGDFRHLNYQFWREMELQNPNLVISNHWNLDYDRGI